MATARTFAGGHELPGGVKVGGNIRLGIEGWERKHPPDTEMKEKFCLIFALPHISALTPRKSICQDMWQSGLRSPHGDLARSRSERGVFLRLIVSELSPTGSKPQSLQDDTQEKYVLAFSSREVPAPLKLPESRRSPPP